MELKLTDQFVQMVALAHERKGQHVSETVINKLFENKLFSEEEMNNVFLLNNKIEDAATINIFPGVGEQNGAVLALTNLALRYDILLDPAIESLKNINIKNPALLTDCIKRLVEKKLNYLHEYNSSKSN